MRIERGVRRERLLRQPPSHERGRGQKGDEEHRYENASH
jgi:hypothetical protein